MGASNRQGGRIYYTVHEGKFTRRVAAGFVDEAGQVAVPRVLDKGPNAGKTIHEVKYSDFDGVITYVERKESEYGTDVSITFDNKEIVQLKESSQQGKAFLKVFPNIDLAQTVNFSLSQEDAVVNGETTKVTSLFIKQNDKLVPYAHTKDAPNGMPPFTVVTVNGKKVNDYTAQLSFLWKAPTAKFPPQLTKSQVTKAVEYPKDAPNPADIPF